MYGGLGGGRAVEGVVGTVATTAGITMLPNTSGNSALTVLSIATLVLGILVLTSFVITQVIRKRSK